MHSQNCCVRTHTIQDIDVGMLACTKVGRHKWDDG